MLLLMIITSLLVAIVVGSFRCLSVDGVVLLPVLLLIRMLLSRILLVVLLIMILVLIVAVVGLLTIVYARSIITLITTMESLVVLGIIILKILPATAATFSYIVLPIVFVEPAPSISSTSMA